MLARPVKEESSAPREGQKVRVRAYAAGKPRRRAAVGLLTNTMYSHYSSEPRLLGCRPALKHGHAVKI